MDSPAPLNTPVSQLLSQYLVDWESLDWPLVWDDCFVRPAPVVMEIGFGNGDYLVRTAQTRPGENFIGVEIAWSCVHRALRRLESPRLKNVLLLHGEAGFLLDNLFADGSLNEVVANFSDPWPKSKHHGRRLIQRDLLNKLARCIRPGGKLLIATDHGEYAGWIREVLESQNHFASEYATASVSEVPDRIVTRYEAKARESGTPIHFFQWRRGPHSREALAPPSNSRIFPMPHAVLNGGLSPDSVNSLAGSCEQTEHANQTVLVRFLGVFHRQESQELLIETLVRESGLFQHFAVLVAPRQGNHWVVKLSAIGKPRPTWGVKHAVALIAQHLTSVNGMTPVDSKAAQLETVND